MKAIKVGVVTNAQGAHLSSYFESLAKTEEAEAVALADPSGKVEESARKALGGKLKEVHKETAAMLRQFQPQMATIDREVLGVRPHHAVPVRDDREEATRRVFARLPLDDGRWAP